MVPQVTSQIDALNSPIEGIMITDVITMPPEATIAEGAKALQQNIIGVIIIVQDGKLAGIVSERDVATKAVLGNIDPKTTALVQIMSTKVFTARKHHSIASVLNQMENRHIRHIPVVDDDQHVIGIISSRDVLTKVSVHLKQMLLEKTKDLGIDPLTGLYNYRFFTDYIDAEIARSSRRGYHFSLLFMDLDYFKIFNDSHGHTKGNELLNEFAALLKEGDSGSPREFVIRRSDIPVRLGGDEFVLILPETTKEEAYPCAERLRQVAEQRLDLYRDERDRDFHVTVSIGIAEYPADSEKKDDLIEKADQALYKAKRLGRNRVFIYGERTGQRLAG